jgi:transcriptional/translational regulatory protein YebC/TACO1
VENEFPEHYLVEADISLNHDGFHTSDLYIMRGPQIQNELVIEHLIDNGITSIEVLATYRIMKEKGYALFEILHMKNVKKALNEKAIPYEKHRITGIVRGCMSCGDETDLVMIVSSNDVIDDVIECVEKTEVINYGRTHIYTYSIE